MRHGKRTEACPYDPRGREKITRECHQELFVALLCALQIAVARFERGLPVADCGGQRR
jgi:hypothetical protein